MPQDKITNKNSELQNNFSSGVQLTLSRAAPFKLSFSNLSPRPLHRRGSPCAVHGMRLQFICQALIPLSCGEGLGERLEEKRSWKNRENKSGF